ncbi:hypothetical protein SPFM12_00275 [Salmonella phage SPFM12]|nr:hypothetical protein SPFM12_00275 [Salmonella phage SPFM12]
MLIAPTPENFERLVLEELTSVKYDSEEEELLVKSFSNEAPVYEKYVSRWKKEYTFHISGERVRSPSSAIGRFEVEYYAGSPMAEEDFDAQLAACLSALEYIDNHARDYFLVNPRACPQKKIRAQLSQGEEEDKGVALVDFTDTVGHDHRPKELDKIRVVGSPERSPRSFHEEFWLPRVKHLIFILEKLDFIFMHGCFQFQLPVEDEINAAATEAEMAELMATRGDPALDAMVGWVQDEYKAAGVSLNISIGADCLYLAGIGIFYAVRIVEGTPSHDHGQSKIVESQEAVGFLTWLLQWSKATNTDAFYIAGDLFDDSRHLRQEDPTWHIVDVIREVLISCENTLPEGVKRLLNTNDIHLLHKRVLKRSQS